MVLTLTSVHGYWKNHSFRIDWLDLLAVQGTIKSLLQHYNLNASILWHSAFFMVQQHPYITTRKIIALTVRKFVSKVISLLFNTLARLVIAFLPRSKCLLISWLLSLSMMILESKKIKIATVCIVSPSISHEVMGPDATILVFWILILNPVFSLSPFTFIKKALFSTTLISAVRVVSSAFLRLLIFLTTKVVSELSSWIFWREKKSFCLS